MVTVSSVPTAPLTLRRLSYPFAQTLRDCRNPTRARNRAVREGMLLNGLPEVSRSLRHWLASSVGVPDRRGPIWAVVTARDEEVRLPGVLEHLVQQGADHLVVADHMSSDRTADVVAELARDLPITLLQDREPGRYQARKISRLARAASRRGRLGSCRSMPMSSGTASACRSRRFSVAVKLTSTRRRLSITFRRSTRRMPRIPSSRSCGAGPQPSTKKVAFRGHLLAAVHQGNHWVNLPGEVRRGCLEIRHFPFLGLKHLRRKIETHMKSFERTPDVVMGSHVVHWARLDESTLRSAGERERAYRCRSSPLGRGAVGTITQSTPSPASSLFSDR